MTSSKNTSIQLVHAVGFSNGCGAVYVVEAAAVGSELLDDLWLATGPPVTCWLLPAKVVMSVPAGKFCTMPAAMKMIAPTTATGSSSRRRSE